jgi:predicted dehydrogenase
MKRLGVGMIGLGLAVKPHALALRELDERAQFVGGFSPTAERRREFERTYGLPAVASLDALLGDPRVDAVIVLTPPRTHAELAVRAAQAGKHVLLEKPIDVTLDAARAVVEAVEATGKKLGVVFQYRFRKGTSTLRTLLAEGALGDLLSVSCAVRWWRSAEMLDLAGPAQRVSAFCRTSPLRSIDTEDIACAAVSFRNGALGVVDATTTAYPGYPERIEFAGTKGSALWEAERLTVHRHGQAPLQVEGSSAGGGGADPMAFSHEWHRRLIEHFLDAVRAGREPQVSGRSALKVHALIDAMLASSRAGAPVEVASLG